MTQSVIPQAAELSKTVQLEVSETGGPVGFVYGSSPWQAKYWLEERVPAFLLEYIEDR